MLLVALDNACDVRDDLCEHGWQRCCRLWGRRGQIAGVWGVVPMHDKVEGRQDRPKEELMHSLGTTSGLLLRGLLRSQSRLLHVSGVLAACAAAMPALAQEAATATAGAAPVAESLRVAGETAGNTLNKFAQTVEGDPWRYGHFIAAGISLIIVLAADLARPGSLSRAGVRKLSEHSSIIWFLCGLLVLGAQIVGSGFAAYLPASWRDGGDLSSLKYQAVAQGVSYLAALVTAFVLVRILASSSKGAGLTFSARAFAWGLLGFALAWPLVMSSSIGFAAIHESTTGTKIADQLGHPTLRLLVEHQSSPWAWVIGLCAIVAAPLLEEIIYRGFVQSAFHRLTNSPWLAIVLGSLVFAGVHAIPTQQASGEWVFTIPWYSAATVGVLGLCCGIAYERTKEIGVPIAMHVLFNAANVTLALLVSKPG